MSSNDLEFRYDDGKSPLALLAETCRNIGVDTTTSKLAKSSIVHNVCSQRLFTSKSSNSPSSSIESRKSNDSVSPSINGSDKQSNFSSNSRISANSVPNNREPTKFSFKPYEDNVICKKTSTEDSRSHSACNHPQVVQRSISPLNNDNCKINKDNNNSVNASNTDSVITKRESETNSQSPSTTHSNGYEEKHKKIRSSSSKSSLPNTSPTLPKSSPSSSSATSTSTSTPTSTSTSVTYPTDSSSKLHQLTSDSVNKFVHSPYMGLPHHPQPQVAAVTGYCHTNVCRDPFCPGCRFNAACKVLGQVSTCAAGCAQCSNASPSMSSTNSPYLTGNAFYPLLPVPHHPSNPINQASNPSSVTQPDNNFADKREAHHHLRNHASSDPSVAAFLGQYSLYPPMLTDPLAGLRRTIYDPINRYHPYKPFPNPTNGLTSGLPHLPLAHSVSPRSQITLSYPPQGPYTGRLGPPIPP